MNTANEKLPDDRLNAAALLGAAEREAWSDFDDALSRAFGKIEGAAKDTKGARSKYANLASVTDAIKEHLVAEGFSWPQFTSMADGEVTVVTQLRRKGLFISSSLTMRVGERAGPQDIGSAITYARRYALSAITGVAPEDDDGESAQKASKQQAKSKPAPKKERPPMHQQQQRTGGWRESADKVTLQADADFRKLVKQRIGLIRELEVSREAMEHSTTAFISEVLDVPVHNGGFDAMAPGFSLDQWGKLNDRLREDVKTLEGMKNAKDTFKGDGDPYDPTVDMWEGDR